MSSSFWTARQRVAIRSASLKTVGRCRRVAISPGQGRPTLRNDGCEAADTARREAWCTMINSWCSKCLALPGAYIAHGALLGKFPKISECTDRHG